MAREAIDGEGFGAGLAAGFETGLGAFAAPPVRELPPVEREAIEGEGFVAGLAVGLGAGLGADTLPREATDDERGAEGLETEGRFVCGARETVR